MSRLTKKDFESTAAIIREIRDRRKREHRIEECITQFIKSNPRFDQERFRALCSPSAKKKNTLSLPPDVSYTHLVKVDTSEWWPDSKFQWDEISTVTYKGARYDIEKDCTRTRFYPESHAWAGQHQQTSILMSHVFEQFTGKKAWCGCGVAGGEGPGGYRPSYTVKDFLSDFLFQVEHTEHAECCSAYQVYMTYHVEPEDRTLFEKSLAHIANVIRNVKFEFTKDQPKKD